MCWKAQIHGRRLIYAGPIFPVLRPRSHSTLHPSRDILPPQAQQRYESQPLPAELSLSSLTPGRRPRKYRFTNRIGLPSRARRSHHKVKMEAKAARTQGQAHGGRDHRMGHHGLDDILNDYDTALSGQDLGPVRDIGAFKGWFGRASSCHVLKC